MADTFHLNHVGYKEELAGVFFAKPYSFHLNHVGYKVVGKETPAEASKDFHLNHVGYKDCDASLYNSCFLLSSEPCGI